MAAAKTSREKIEEQFEKLFGQFWKDILGPEAVKDKDVLKKTPEEAPATTPVKGTVRYGQEPNKPKP